jgi:hypothetical protein
MSSYKSILDSCSFYYVGAYPHKYKAVNLHSNKPLKQLLIDNGFFDFHTSNKGSLVYYHQVIAFFNCGGIHALKRGFTCVKGVTEIHHLNGKTWDNSPSNLVYITEEGHNIITTHQRSFNKYIRRVKRSSLLNYWNGVIWNTQGRRVTNFVDWLFFILGLTIALMANKLNKDYLVSVYRMMQNKGDTSLVNLPLLLE